LANLLKAARNKDHYVTTFDRIYRRRWAWTEDYIWYQVQLSIGGHFGIGRQHRNPASHAGRTSAVATTATAATGIHATSNVRHKPPEGLVGRNGATLVDRDRAPIMAHSIATMTPTGERQ
jgi:hypothetical protein